MAETGIPLRVQVLTKYLSHMRHQKLLNSITFLIARFFVYTKNWLVEFSPKGFLLFGAVSISKSSLADDLVNIVIAVGISIVSVFVQQKIRVGKATKNLRKLLSLYASPAISDFVICDKSNLGLKTEQRLITVLFCDIRGYTTLTERRTPEEVVGILNRYFSSMSAEIISFKGIVNKYIGDAILAFWEETPSEYCQAENALFAASAMLRRLEKLNDELVSKGLESIQIGIGVCTGIAMVGTVGSEFKYDFTVIGDVVNTASRLQSLAKEFKVPIVVSDATRKALSSSLLFSLPALGEVTIRGKAKPQKIFTIDPQHFSE